MIDQLTEQRIKDAANIVDVVSEFQTLKRHGKRYMGLCPFHDDTHIGSFVVGGTHNTCHCYACNRDWDSIAYLREKEGMTYKDALLWLGSKFGVYVDDSQQVKIKKKCEPLQREEKRELVTFPLSFVKQKMPQDGNTLIAWMRGLDWSDECRKMLDYYLQLYAVGTMTSEWENGWTIWWYINTEHKATDGKIMKYSADGHRDKSKVKTKEGKERTCYNINWISAKLEKAGQFDSDTQRTEQCLFGLHLLPLVDDNQDIEVCIVESEKTAILCAALSNPDRKLWMATGGKGNLDKDMLKPLLDRGCKIAIFPDHDGYDEWKRDAKAIDPKITVQRLEDWGWQPIDGDKADIADVMLRRMQLVVPESETPSERAHRKLGLKEENKALTMLIDKLDLH